VKALRNYTTFTLFGRRTAETLPFCLHDASPGIRAEAARTLGFMGTVAEPVALELNALLDDHEESVRNAAREALDRIQRQSTNKTADGHR
jgi:hypothetical protein